jgi:hypothetical protein
VNPFADEIEPLGVCSKDVEDCRHLVEASFLPFGNTPKKPAKDKVRGSVLLIAGGKGQGKSVFGHRLLHYYRSDQLRPVDLMWRIGTIVSTPAQRERVLDHLGKCTGEAIAPGGNGAPAHDDSWPDRLQSILEQVSSSLLVRLPAVKPPQGEVDHAGIAWEIVQYSLAARQNSSVFIYEYFSENWPADWEALLAQIDQNHDAVVQKLPLKTMSADDLWHYVEKVMDRSPHKEITLNPDVPEFLKKFFRANSAVFHPTNTHKFMRLAFADAINEQSPQVTQYHFANAALTVGRESK